MHIIIFTHNIIAKNIRYVTPKFCLSLALSYLPVESYNDKIKITIMLIRRNTSFNTDKINSKMLLNGRIIIMYNKKIIFKPKIILVDVTACLKIIQIEY